MLSSTLLLLIPQPLLQPLTGTMRIIGGAIGPVIAGLFLGLYTSEVTTSEGVISSVPNTTAFNAIFLVGSITSLSLVALMLIMKRRAISMGMPAHSSKR